MIYVQADPGSDTRRGIEPADNWENFAYAKMYEVAERFELFTADEVAKAIAERPAEQENGDIRCMFLKLERAKVIERTDSFMRSKRKTQHGRHLRVWKSRIHRAGAESVEPENYDLCPECGCIRRKRLTG